MKVEAYQCDNCLKLVSSESASGFDSNKDLFDFRHSYKVVLNPAKADYHFCMDCYNEQVLTPITYVTNRAKDEEDYKRKLDEYTYTFKVQILAKAAKNKKRK